MLIQYGPVIENASGSIGNVTASKNKGGQYFRVRAIPLNPQTEYQMEQRNRITALSQGWAALTEIQRSGWTALGNSVKEKDPFGNARAISGIAAFIRSNSPVLMVGATMLEDAPANMQVQTRNITSVAVDHTGTITVVHAGTALPADTYLMAEMTPNAVPASIEFVKNLVRYAGATTPSVPAGTDIDFDPDRFTAAAASSVYVKIVAMNALNGGRNTLKEGFFTVS